MPAGTSAPTEIVASAVPPGAVAGERSVRAIVPAAGAGSTAVTSMSTTVPSGSVAVTAALAAVPATVVSDPPQVTVTGELPVPGSKVWAPSPSKVFWAKPSHSAAGSNASPPSVSPALTVGNRRIVLSAVLVRPVPHSLPGSNPIWPMMSTAAPPLRSASASSPLKLMTDDEIWSAWARMAGSALAWDSTWTSPSATVPVRATVWLGVGDPLLYSSSVYPPAARSIDAPVPLKISTALLKLDPSMYSERNTSVGTAAAAGAAVPPSTAAGVAKPAAKATTRARSERERIR